MQQRRVEVRTGDGLMDVHIHHPAGPGSWPAVILYMDAMGIRPDRQPETASKIGTVGYCMGGGYALAAAAHRPNRVVAAASFLGGRLATDRPDSPHLLAPRIKGKVYIGVAGIDPMFSDEEREQLHGALEAAEVDFSLEVYPGVRHGFTVTGHPVYDEAGSEWHWQRLLSLDGGSLASD